MATFGSCYKTEAQDPEARSVKVGVAIVAVGTSPLLLQVGMGTPSLCDEV